MRFLSKLRPVMLGAMMVAATLARAAPVNFDIPVQPASTALVAFARQAGVEVLFSYGDLKEVQANAVGGVHETEAAIRQLLRGTGFTATRDAAGKYVVTRERPTREIGAIRGSVVAAESGEPIAGAAVHALDAERTTRTGAAGGFALRDVPAGGQTLLIQAEGYATVRVPGVAVQASEQIDLGPVRLEKTNDGPQQLDEVTVDSTDLVPGVVELQEVVVTPSRFGIDQERGLISATLTETELQALPQLGEDLYRAIARLPGLAADDYTAKFWVRGAPHEQVLARLDGLDLVEPFHMKDTDSSLAIVDLESINRIALFTGGFTAEYGGALAGVLTMETDSHVRAHPRTSLGWSLTGARVGSRGMTKSGRGRWLVSGRTGNPDIALEDDDDGTTLKLRYHDYAGKWEFDVAPGHTVSVHAMHGGDTADYSEPGRRVLTSSYDSDYVWTRWRGKVGPRLEGEAVLSYAGLSWQREGEGEINNTFPVDVEDHRELELMTFRQDWTLNATDRFLWRGGLDFKWGDASYRYDGSREIGVLRDGVVVRETRSRTSRVEPEGMSAGGYLAARVQPVPAFTVEPGVRYDWNDYAGDSDVSPRLNAAYNFGRSTVRAAWGFYHQAQGLHELASRDDDIQFRRSEQAEHRVLSFEHRLESRIALRLEAYERRVTHPRLRWGNRINNIAAFPEWEDDRARFDPVSQNARGVEFVAERRIGGKWSWSGSYAWSKSEETLRDGRTVRRARDQTHSLYCDIAYAPNPRWQFSASWQSHTGWPTTEVDFSLVTLGNGETVVAGRSGPLYGSQLPTYQRLDLRVQRRFAFGRNVVRVYVDLFNVFDSENTIEYGYNVSVENGQLVRTRYSGERQLQRLVTGGVAWDF